MSESSNLVRLAEIIETPAGELRYMEECYCLLAVLPKDSQQRVLRWLADVLADQEVEKSND